MKRVKHRRWKQHEYRILPYKHPPPNKRPPFFWLSIAKIKKKVQVTGFLYKAVYTTTSVAGSCAGAEKSWGLGEVAFLKNRLSGSLTIFPSVLGHVPTSPPPLPSENRPKSCVGLPTHFVWKWLVYLANLGGKRGKTHNKPLVGPQF